MILILPKYRNIESLSLFQNLTFHKPSQHSGKFHTFAPAAFKKLYTPNTEFTLSVLLQHLFELMKEAMPFNFLLFDSPKLIHIIDSLKNQGARAVEKVLLVLEEARVQFSPPPTGKL